ncbi:MAG: family 10 glycosylhydrolase, partial [Chlorobi bacterium]|nr:family 10 glycosylhydrolase [Chlorobiota bacterium]
MFIRFKIPTILFAVFVLIIKTSAQTPDGKEMRGVWIATVKNLDYPSSKFLSSEEQKKEFTDMLDYFSKIGINAVFFQIRPAADAFFPSKYEPWSEWLTGKQGKA